MNAHAYFESLGGAIALGEADDAERAAFGAHARECRSCAQVADVADGQLRAFATAARVEERWAPVVRGALEERILERRSRRKEGAIAALGYACAISLALNVGASLGLGPRLVEALHPEAPALPVIAYVVVHPSRSVTR